MANYTISKSGSEITINGFVPIGVEDFTVQAIGDDVYIHGEGQRWKINVTADTVTVNGAPFTGTAAQLRDKLAAEVFNGEALSVQGIKVSKTASLKLKATSNALMVSEGTLHKLFDGVVGDYSLSPNAVISYDTTLRKKNPASSLRFTLNDASYDAKIMRSIDLTLSDSDIVGVWLYVDEPRHINKIDIDLSAATDKTDWTNHYRKRLEYEYTPGWNFVKFMKQDCAAIGTPTWGAMKSLRVRLYAVAGTAPVLYLDSVVLNCKAAPAVLLNFDDSHPSLLQNAFPYLQSKGMKATLFVAGRSYNPNYLGAASVNAMNDAQHSQLYDSGWDLGNHSKTHNDVVDLLSSTDTAAQQEEMEYIYNRLLTKGWTRGALFFACPNGKYNATTEAVLRAMDYKVVRTSWGGAITYADGDTFYIPTKEIRSTTTLPEMQAWIDDAIRLGNQVSIFTHGVVVGNTDAYSIDYSLFTQLVDYIEASGIATYTFSEWWDACFQASFYLPVEFLDPAYRLPESTENLVSLDAQETITGKKTFAPTLTATANGQVLAAVEINPTYVAGSYTGLVQAFLNLVGNARINATNQLIFLRNGVPVFTATSAQTNVSSPSASAPLTLAINQGGTVGAQLMPTTANMQVQNGGTYTDIPSARLAVNSTTQGFLVPRMTTAQRTAISSPAEGLEVYDTTLKKKCFYNGTAWEAITSAVV